ncbi:membrane protein implicated in regulation of membrane protease activity [Elusimicrobium posterum]|uniref:NfeD family protein n=1 Tax=Elusimicrobium posterum TaxID=3116653 RepID=UPI003C716BBB
MAYNRLFILIAELFTAEFSLACIGLSFLSMSLPAYFGLPFFVQAMVFAAVGLVLFFNVRPFALKYLHKKTKDLKTNADALIGRKAVVYEDINAETKKGSIKIDGDIWSAIAAKNIAAGTEVTVEKMEGIICTVK